MWLHKWKKVDTYMKKVDTYMKTVDTEIKKKSIDEWKSRYINENSGKWMKIGMHKGKKLIHKWNRWIHKKGYIEWKCGH